MATKKRAAARRNVREQGSGGFGAKEVALLASVFSEFNETTITKADVDLALDDRGWLRNGSQAAALAEMDVVTRRQMIAKARLYWHRDPLAKQSVRLWTDYAINTGCTFQVTIDEDTDAAEAAAGDTGAAPVDGDDDDAPQQQVLDRFWNDKRNRKYTSPEGQRQLSKRLLVDGEIFFVIMETAKGPVLRRVDPIEITDFIKDPEDSDTTLCYRREAIIGGRTVVQYYQDWTADEDDMSLLDSVKGPNGEVIQDKLRDDCVMYHAPFDCFKDRGNSLLAPALDWSREHRRFMESRVALLQALAKFAYKITAKGGQKAVDKVAALMQSTFTQGLGTGVERNPKTAAGSTWTQNQGAELEAMPRTTGGAESKNDGDQLKLMVSAATGIMLHYYGDPSTGNLATSTAMELPMLKQFEAYQAQWEGIWRDIFTILLGEEPMDEELTPIDIDYPPIVKADINLLATAMASFTTAFPELKVKPIISMILTALGINNQKEVMDMMEEKKKENEAQQEKEFGQSLQLAAKQPPLDPKTGKSPVAVKESETVELANAITRLCEAMEA